MNVKRVSQVSNLLTFFISTLLLFITYNFPIINITLTSNINFIINYFSNYDFQLSNDNFASIFIFLLIIINLWKIISVKNKYFVFDDDRIIMYNGIFNKDIDYIEYYRIKDYTVKQNIIQRFFNLHNIKIISTDRTHPNLNIKYLKNFNNTEELLRNGINNSTKNGRGREIDVV